jgi:SPP1 gp7 family putative phage head morphogenesis protein
VRNNAGLDQAESQKEFKRFIRQVQKVIKAQVTETVENDQLITDLLSLLPQVEKAEANQNVVGYLTRSWISFEDKFQELFDEDTLSAYYTWAATQGGTNALERMGIEVGFTLRNDAVTNFLKQRENLLIRSVDDTTKEAIARLLEKSRDAGLTEFEIKEAILEHFDEIIPARAEAIARTELAEAFNATEYETYVRNGVKKMRWVTVIDERVCEICAPLHNEETAVGQSFSGGQTRPPAHVNCRCFLEEVIAGVALRGNALIWTGE